MRQLPGKLLIGEVETKKIKKIAELLLKLFFLTKKVGKIKIAERFFGIPTVTKLLPALNKTSLFYNETHKRKS